MDHLDLALASKQVEPPGQLPDDRLLPTAERVEVDLGSPKRDSVRPHLFGLGNDPGRVQKRLRWDTADVEADAPKALVPLDQDRLQP